MQFWLQNFVNTSHGKDDVCMKRITVKQLFADPQKYADGEVTVAGWARTIRASNAFGFIELNDGSYLKNLQVVIEAEKLDNYPCWDMKPARTSNWKTITLEPFPNVWRHS